MYSSCSSMRPKRFEFLDFRPTHNRSGIDVKNLTALDAYELSLHPFFNGSLHCDLLLRLRRGNVPRCHRQNTSSDATRTSDTVRCLLSLTQSLTDCFLFNISGFRYSNSNERVLVRITHTHTKHSTHHQ